MIQVNIDIGTFISWLKVLGLLAWVTTTASLAVIFLIRGLSWVAEKVWGL